MNTIKCPGKRHGFSLVQISMLMVVSSIVMVSLLPGGQAGKDEEKIRVTKQRMEAIEGATANFMAKNLRRPCPADGSQPPESANYGLENGTPGDCSGGAVFRVGGMNVTAGTVPVKTLGLTADYALDGYGRHIMYFVDARATTSISPDITVVNTCQDLQNNAMHGDLQIANNFSEAMAKDYVMWALVSYGKDGNGAFPSNGSGQDGRINIASSDESTLHNAIQYTFGDQSPLNGSVIVGQRLASAAPTSTFDDIVWSLESTKNTCCMGKACTQGTSLRNSALNATSGGSDAVTGYTVQYMGTNLAKGDINGDGIQDLVIAQPCYGASSAACGGTPAGRAYVKFGSKLGWNAPTTALELSALDGINGFTIKNGCGENGNTFISKMGRSVAVGDMNGDGFDDILLSALGKSVLIYGKSSFASVVNVNALVSNTSGFILGNNGTVHGGASAMGDINGDGFKDFILGDNIWSVLGHAVFGRTTAKFHAKTTSSAQPTCNNATPSYWNVAAVTDPIDVLRISGHNGNVSQCPALGYSTTATLTSGSAVATAVTGLTGAVVGDAISTTAGTGIAIGTKIQAFDAGAKTLTLDAKATASGSFTLAYGSWLISTFYHIVNVDSADVNGDGIDDIIIGAHPDQLVLVIFGRPSRTVDGGYAAAMTTRYGVPTGVGLAKTPPAYSHTWDGTVTAGINYFCVSRDNGGRPSVDAGRFTTPTNYYRTVRLGVTDTYFGHQLTHGDLNNDGYADLLLASSTRLYAYSGRAFTTGNWQAQAVTLSTSNSMVMTMSTAMPSWITSGTMPNYVTVGDANNDGLQDLLIGSYSSSGNGGNANSKGSVFVAFQDSTGWSNGAKTFFGNSASNWFAGTSAASTGLPLASSSKSRGFRIDGPAASSFVSQSITGDFNGDGKIDIAIASPGSPGTSSAAGRTYILWGRSNVPWSSTAPETLSDIE